MFHFWCFIDVQASDLLTRLRAIDSKAKSSRRWKPPVADTTEEDDEDAQESRQGRLLSLLLQYDAATPTERQELVVDDLCVPMLASMLPGEPVSHVAARKHARAQHGRRMACW